ncbi:hypothetical protein [Naasia sp. SYSU D00948]|uniref:hypothetical protein n=1 Tax=Naasia sp. SYSU D00948 TaxID=2817379 RepID=UPI001B301D9A|nr:hypothetical protein [Naasia sp. SYSU D00948]
MTPHDPTVSTPPEVPPARGRTVSVRLTAVTAAGALLLGAAVAGGIGAAVASSAAERSAATAAELDRAGRQIEDLGKRLTEAEDELEAAEAAAAASEARAVAAEEALVGKEAELSQYTEAARQAYEPSEADIIAAATQRFHDAAEAMGISVGPMKEGCSTSPENSGTLRSYNTAPPRFGLTDSLYASAQITVSTSAEDSIDYAWYVCEKG